jgi:hypothetical protein
MPTILTEEKALEWLTPDLTEKRITELATFQIPCEDMIAYTIRKEFRSDMNPTEKFIYPELPELVV